MSRQPLDPSLQTGIDDIDRHHETLFQWADVVLGRSRDDREVTPARAMVFLAGYVEYHFAAEEFAMKLFEYPDAEDHRRAHEGIRRTVKALRDEIASTGVTPEATLRLRRLMWNWLQLHIRTVDGRFAEFLTRNSTSEEPFELATPEFLRDRGWLAGISLDDVRVVHAPGEITAAEVRARRRAYV